MLAFPVPAPRFSGVALPQAEYAPTSRFCASLLALPRYLLGALALGACSGGPDQPAGGQAGTDAPALSAEALAAARDSALQDLDRAGARFGTTEAAIRAALGAPARTRQLAPLGEQYAALGDSIVMLEYSRMEFGLYRVLPERRDLLAAVTITDSSVNIVPGIAVGSPRGEVLARYGAPYAGAGADTVEYATSLGGNSVAFIFRDDRVAAVRWSYFID